jgi:hypothetical protein
MKLLQLSSLCIETLLVFFSTAHAVHHHQFSHVGFNGNIDQIANEFQLINNAVPYTKSQESDIRGLESTGKISTHSK